MKAVELICDVCRRSRKIELPEFRVKMVLLNAAAAASIASIASMPPSLLSLPMLLPKYTIHPQMPEATLGGKVSI